MGEIGAGSAAHGMGGFKKKRVDLSRLEIIEQMEPSGRNKFLDGVKQAPVDAAMTVTVPQVNANGGIEGAYAPNHGVYLPGMKAPGIFKRRARPPGLGKPFHGMRPFKIRYDENVVYPHNH
jgi:hypothetical protein